MYFMLLKPGGIKKLDTAITVLFILPLGMRLPGMIAKQGIRQ